MIRFGVGLLFLAQKILLFSPVYLPNLTVIQYPVGMIRVLISRGITTDTCIGKFS